jgi:DNA-binding NarL/FixJ family response regulator
MTRTVRVMVVDDNALFRLGLKRLLMDDRRLEVIADASDGKEAVDLAAVHSPDVVLMDSRMPNMDGIEAMQRIIAQQPDVKVLFLSSFENEGDVLQAMRRGAGGYVLKDAMPEAIISSIFAVDSGQRVLSGNVVDRVMEIASGVRAGDEDSDGMTSREIEVLKLMSSGLANKQIAFRLRISEKTVRNHISHIYEKIGVVDRAQAALYAVRKGLIQA